MIVDIDRLQDIIQKIQGLEEVDYEEQVGIPEGLSVAESVWGGHPFYNKREAMMLQEISGLKTQLKDLLDAGANAQDPIILELFLDMKRKLARFERLAHN